MEASRPESAAARLERERDFHNARFEHDARDAQLQYYDAIADCFRDYWARVNQLAAGADIMEYACAYGDRKSVRSGESVSVRVYLGGGRSFKTQNKNNKNIMSIIFYQN